MIDNREYGLVLAGGGTKGAYQVGVWKALKELNINIKGIVGASIGSLNGALFLQDDFKMVEDMYENIKLGNIMNVDGMNENKNIFSLSNIFNLAADYTKQKGIDNTPLRNMIRKTIFAVSTEENRPIFTGCLFEVENNKLNVVAVDGFRLAWRSSFLNVQANDFSAVIPGKTLNEVNKIISDSFEPIKIGISKNQALFEMDNCKIVTRVLDGEFLNYANVIPKEWDTRIRVNKNILQSCFERISLISSSSVEKEKKYPVKVTVDIGKLTISCTNQTGDAKEEIYVSTEGKNLEAGFNPKYFLDALRNIDDEEIFVDFGTSISPCIIRPVDEEGDYTYMILPIKLKD